MSDVNNSSLDESHPRGQQQYSQPSWPDHVTIPETFLCPLSKKFMNHPVIDREGNSYEREAIFKYLRDREQLGMAVISPVTKNPLQESDLVDNRALQSIIDSALKNALAQEREAHINSISSKKSMSRRFRVVNSLKTGMKAIATMQIAPASVRKERKAIEAERMYGEGDSSSSSGSEDESHGASRLGRNDNNKLGLEPVVEDTTNDSQQSNNAEGKEAAQMEATPRDNKEKGLDQGVSFVDRFDKRLNKRLSQVPANPIYRRATTADEYEERMKKKLSQDAADSINRRATTADESEERMKKKLSQVPANPIYRRASTADEYEERMKKKLSQDAADSINRRGSTADESEERMKKKLSQVPADSINRRASTADEYEERTKKKLSQDAADSINRRASTADESEERMKKKLSQVPTDSINRRGSTADEYEERMNKRLSQVPADSINRRASTADESEERMKQKLSQDAAYAIDRKDSKADKFEERFKEKIPQVPAGANDRRGSAAGRFEERMNKRLSQDSTAREKYERKARKAKSAQQRKEEGLQKKSSRGSGRDKDRVTTIIKESLIDSVVSETTSDGSAELSREDSNVSGGTNRSNVNYSLDTSHGSKEEGGYVRLQEERRNKRRGKRNALTDSWKHYYELPGERKTQRRGKRNVSDEKIKKSHPGSMVSETAEDEDQSSSRGVPVEQSNTKDSLDNSSSESEFSSKQEVDYTQVQEKRKTQRRGKRNVLDDKIKTALRSSMVSLMTDDVSHADQSSSDREAEKHSEELDHAQLQVEKRSRKGRRNVLDLDEKIRMPLGGSMVSEIGEDTLLEDQSSWGKSTERRSNTKHSWYTRDGPSGSKSDNKEVARHKQALKERRRRTEGDGRSVPDENFRKSQTKSAKAKHASVISTKDSMPHQGTDDHTKITVQFDKTFVESRRVSDLIIGEGNEDSDEISITIGPTIHEEQTLENSDDMLQKSMHESGCFSFERGDGLISWSDLGGALVQAEMKSIQTPLPAKTPEAPRKTPAKSGSTLTESFRLEPTDKKMTWDDLDKDIERAQFLSMKVADSEAVKTQVELETFMQAGTFDSEPQPSSGRGVGHIIAQRKVRERQQQERRLENVVSAPAETFASKIDSIMEVMEGSDKTQFDVLDALKTTKGRREAALGLLLGSKSSSFTNRAAYN